MRVARRHDRTKAAGMGSEWDARLRRAALGAGLLGLLLLPAGAWAASPNVETANLTVVTPSGGAGMMVLQATPINDRELATEVAKGVPDPMASNGPVIQPPVVILWDEIDRPGSLSGMGNAAAIDTSTSWH